MKNKVQLVTYANRFGGSTLAELHDLMVGPITGLFEGVHILPFFLPVDGADAGFDPIDHTQVDPKVGDWSDIKRIAGDCDVMADAIVNHMSTGSAQFEDYELRGDASPYRGLFLALEDVYPDGLPASGQPGIYRPRPGLPFTRFRLKNGEERMLWTTFTPQQVDINVESREGAEYLGGILQRFRDNAVSMIRLDAVGYAIKRPGTSCFMLPETFAFIADLGGRARRLGMEVLVEIHAHYRRQMEIARQVDWVYDFALPPLILHAFTFGTAKYLREWVNIRPQNAVTVLDTHDGIGIIDVGSDTMHGEAHPGLVPPDDLLQLVEIIHQRTRGGSRQATGAAATNLDLYQINSTFFDAMGRDEDQYLLARAIQFFLPGIPQVYYVGLLAGHNDLTLLAQTGIGRDINRHYYSRDEVLRELERPVVRRLIDLIRLRNEHPAFNGSFGMEDGATDTLLFRWVQEDAWAELSVNFAECSGELRYTKGSDIVRVGFGRGESRDEPARAALPRRSSPR
jgi:sucrose phosphorylase